MDHPSWDPLCDLVLGWHGRVGGRRCVAIGGGVASGKSSVARRLRSRSVAHVAVVAADDFLHSNAELERRGWAADKGRPAHLRREALTDTVSRLMSGEAGSRPGLLTSALRRRGGRLAPGRPGADGAGRGAPRSGRATLGALVDLGVFLDTPQEIAHRRYLQRIDDSWPRPGTTPSRFYAWAVDLDPDTVRSVVDALWNELNVPILADDVAPSATRADVVVSIDGDERMTSRDRRVASFASP